MMTALVLLVQSGLLAQKGVSRRFIGGIIAGASFTQVDGDGAAGFNRLGLQTGLRVSAALHRRWWMTMEMLFSQKGSRAKITDIKPGVKIRANYLEVPIYVTFLDWANETASGEEYMKIHANLGFTYGYLIGGSTEGLQSNADVNKYMGNSDFSIMAGASVQFNRHLGLDFRWTNSLLPMGFDDVRNRLLTMRMQWLF